MTVQASDIGRELSVATPTPLQESQWTAWIAEALYLIGRRYNVSSLPTADVDYVVLHAVVDHARNPSNSTQVDVQTDDTRVSKRYQSGTGRVTISDELWDILEGDPRPTGAFTVRPYFAPVDPGPCL